MSGPRDDLRSTPTSLLGAPRWRSALAAVTRWFRGGAGEAAPPGVTAGRQDELPPWALASFATALNAMRTVAQRDTLAASAAGDRRGERAARTRERAYAEMDAEGALAYLPAAWRDLVRENVRGAARDAASSTLFDRPLGTVATVEEARAFTVAWETAARHAFGPTAAAVVWQAVHPNDAESVDDAIRRWAGADAAVRLSDLPERDRDRDARLAVCERIASVAATGVLDPRLLAPAVAVTLPEPPAAAALGAREAGGGWEVGEGADPFLGVTAARIAAFRDRVLRRPHQTRAAFVMAFRDVLEPDVLAPGTHIVWDDPDGPLATADSYHRVIAVGGETTAAIDRFCAGDRSLDAVDAIHTLVHEAYHTTHASAGHVPLATGEAAGERWRDGYRYRPYVEGLVEYAAQRFTARAVFGVSDTPDTPPAWQDRTAAVYLHETACMRAVHDGLGPGAFSELWSAPTAYDRAYLLAGQVQALRTVTAGGAPAEPASDAGRSRPPRVRPARPTPARAASPQTNAAGTRTGPASACPRLRPLGV